jgi:hypothetical protein
MSYAPATNGREEEVVTPKVFRETMLAIVERREHKHARPIEAYADDIGATVQRALDCCADAAKPCYVNAVKNLQQRGLLRFEQCAGTGTMYMSPTYAGYQWFEREMPGKYLEIVRKVVEEEKANKPVVRRYSGVSV